MPVNPSGPSPLSYDEWIAKFELLGAQYHPTGVDRHGFAGWLCARRICDFDPISLGNAPQISRTVRDTRLDDRHHYYLLFQCAGQTLTDQNNR